MSSSSPSRLSDTLSGKIILALFLAGFALLLTAATDGRWHSLFLPAIPLAAGLILFIISVLRGMRIPRLGTLAWLTLGGSAYFFLRAWNGDALYDNWTDMSLILTGCIFYVTGIMMGVSRKHDQLLFGVTATVLILGAVILLIQVITGNHFTILRPSHTLYLEHVGNTGFFGYKNFAGHLMVAGGIFCLGYFTLYGKKSWKWLLVGVISIIGSFWCNSRAIYPNLCLGLLICWILYLCKVYKQTTKFMIGFVGGIVLILFIGAGVLIALSQDKSVIESVSGFWTSGGRFTLSSLAIDAAKDAPLFGHGPLSFENEAIPYFQELAIPNMAHNEYAQSMCDYGFTGFAILLLLLISHLIKGFTAIVKNRGQESISLARMGAAVALLSVAAMHATMEFIWHNGTLVAMSAFCAGIISAGMPDKQQRAGKIANNVTLLLFAILGAGFFSFIAIKSYPIWLNSWKFNAITGNAMNTEKLDLLKESISESHDPDMTISYASFITSINSQRGIVPVEELMFAESALREALTLSPSSHMIKTYLGIVLNMEQKFAESDLLLRPFANKGVFSESIFPWRAIYIMHLSSWADTIINDDPSMSLSIIKETRERLLDQSNHPKIAPKSILELKNRLTLEEMLLEDKGITPNDSWKER